MFSILHFSPSIKTKKNLCTYSAFQSRDLQSDEENCFSSERWPIYSLFCVHTEGEKVADVFWAKCWDWESKAALAVPLRVPGPPPRVILQKGTEQVLLSAASHPTTAPLQHFQSFLHRVIPAVGNKPQLAACHTMSRVKEQVDAWSTKEIFILFLGSWSICH